MSRIQPIDPKNAQGKSKELLETIAAKMGQVPNIFKIMAQAPAVLESYLKFSGALREGALDAKIQEKIALFIAQENQCQYCLAAHTTIGKIAGLDDQTMLDARRGESTEAKERAVLTLAQKIHEQRGSVEDIDVQNAQQAGLNDTEILETLAHVALNTFTNYFNHLTDPEVDFSSPPSL